MAKQTDFASPKWSTSTKIIVTLLIIAGILALLFRFSNLISTLVTAFIIAVLYHPIAEWINKKTRVPWSWSVGVIYLITVVILFGLVLMGGLALIKQIESLISFLQRNIQEIPAFFNQLTNSAFVIGPFEFDFQYIDWNQVGNQLLSTIEPVLARMGTIIGGIATGAVGIIASFLFSLLISFLLLTESQGVRGKIISVRIPGYEEDFSRIGNQIGKIWNEFLRGEAIVFLGRFILYLVVLSALRLRFVLGMALIATIGNFIPYIGVGIVWIINFFIALTQGTTIFGLEPFLYALVVMGVGWITDNMYDSFFTPRILANVLNLHPAAVLIAVLVGLNLFGLLGMFLAPPTLATLRVLFQYVQKKLTDQDPWGGEGPASETRVRKPLFRRIAKKISADTKNMIDAHKDGQSKQEE
jgi:predicted PurR-regulated permease PerM